MRCLKTRLTLICAGLSLSSCATPVPVDSFCTLYSPVVVAKGDGDIKAKLDVKKRILVNEKLYRECPPK